MLQSCAITDVFSKLQTEKIAYYGGYHNYRLQHNKANYQSIFLLLTKNPENVQPRQKDKITQLIKTIYCKRREPFNACQDCASAKAKTRAKTLLAIINSNKCCQRSIFVKNRRNFDFDML